MKNKKLISILKRFPDNAEVCINRQSCPVDSLIFAETNTDDEYIILSAALRSYSDSEKEELKNFFKNSEKSIDKP